MNNSNPVIVDAAPPHFAAIVRIERESAAGSLVALTEGHALAEAMQRGYHVTVALIDGEVAGWAWFGTSLERGGEEIGQVYRIAVTASAQRMGAGRALVSHARARLAERGVQRVRATVEGGAAGVRAFFEATGFAVDAVMMEADAEEGKGRD